jgi:hypothetical protein
MDEESSENNASVTAEEESMDVSSPDELLRQIERQFSNLQTNDKEVLVKQLQRIIGPGINSYAANFFLDMNNWYVIPHIVSNNN